MEPRRRNGAFRRPRTLLLSLGLIPLSLLALDAVDRISEQLFRTDLLPDLINRGLSIGGLLGVVLIAVLFARQRSQSVHRFEALSRRRSEGLTARDEALRERRRQIRAVLQAAESLRIVFQPIIDLSSGRVAGHEALARFGSDGAPGEWFRRAHDVGLGVELELMAVRAALAAKPAEGYVSINVGPDTVMARQFFNVVFDDPEPERIVIELTEHEEFKDYPIVQNLLKKLQRLGIRIAIDDTGSGVSSLQHIVRLSPDLIKLDRSLISFIDTDPVRRTLGVTLALFAGEIGARLIAEGIERPEERDACAEIGIAFGQGYLLGKPDEQPLVDLVGSLDVREAMPTA